VAIITPQAEALVHLARKRRLLDVGGCARLRILLGENRVATSDDARRFLTTAKLVPSAISSALLPALPSAITRLGPYQVLAHLADGGMGSVWLVTRRSDDDRQSTPVLDRPLAGEVVVAKSLHARFAATEEARRRFDREARLMAELRHPHIAAIRDLEVSEDGSPFLVMGFVDSGDLKDLVESQGPLSETLALAIVHQIAEGIAAAYARGIIHRDIKPANVFVRSDGWATLADFGLARSIAAGSTVLTMEGTQIGSPLYMSPEQIRAQGDVDVRSDLYSLGCVLYFCLIGSPPYSGRNVQEVQHRHLTAAIPDVAALRNGISSRTAAIIKRLLSKDRAGRYGSPEETCVALREAMTGSGMTVTMPEAYVDCAPARPQVQRVSSSPAVSVSDRVDPLSLLTTTGDEGPPPTTATPVVDEQEQGLTQSWIALIGEATHVLLYARQDLTLGKLCEPPVDICLRKYPVERFRDDCLRIGRNHLRLRFDAATGRVELNDQGSTHGTTVEGVRLTPNLPLVLPIGRTLPWVIAGSLSLVCHVHARGDDAATPASSTSPAVSGGCGIDHPHALDACVLTRPDNQPGMAYVMVLRRVTIGAPGSHLPIPGVGRTRGEIALIAGRWVWRMEAAAVWKPLVSGMYLEFEGHRLRVVPGSYDHFVPTG